MALKKCPRCELNYIKETEKYCGVCLREMNNKDSAPELEDVCVECDENPVVPGGDLCVFCLRERRKQEKLERLKEKPLDESALTEPDVSEMDEIDIDMDGDGDIPPNELKVIDEELGVEEESYDELVEEEHKQNDEDEDDDYI
ncbi:MAG: hypothetical protein ACOYI4_04690 [Christensenellales bacterium]|jgi:hypothetical protein